MMLSFGLTQQKSVFTATKASLPWHVTLRRTPENLIGNTEQPVSVKFLQQKYSTDLSLEYSFCRRDF